MKALKNYHNQLYQGLNKLVQNKKNLEKVKSIHLINNRIIDYQLFSIKKIYSLVKKYKVMNKVLAKMKLKIFRNKTKKNIIKKAKVFQKALIKF